MPTVRWHLATMISPFFIGMVADRFFAAQKILGVFHILGGILALPGHAGDSNSGFYWIILGLFAAVHANHCPIQQHCLWTND